MRLTALLQRLSPRSGGSRGYCKYLSMLGRSSLMLFCAARRLGQPIFQIFRFVVRRRIAPHGRSSSVGAPTTTGRSRHFGCVAGRRSGERICRKARRLRPRPRPRRPAARGVGGATRRPGRRRVPTAGPPPLSSANRRARRRIQSPAEAGHPPLRARRGPVRRRFGLSSTAGTGPRVRRDGPPA